MKTMLWLQAGSCGGCSISLWNAEAPDVFSLWQHSGVELLWHPSLSTAPAARLLQMLERIEQGVLELTLLCVEGCILTGPAGSGACDLFHGRPRKDLIAALCDKASVVVAIGTCAAYGGVFAAPPNPADAVGLQFLREDRGGGLLASSWRSRGGLPVVNVPGCPSHPTTMVQTLLWLLEGAAPALDEFQRPLEFFSTTVHSGCTRNEYHEYDVEETDFGQAGCLYYNLGCQGPIALAACNQVLWNGLNSKTRAGVPCFACMAPSFPRSRDLFKTEKLGEIPVEMPLGVERARYLAYKGLAKAATPARLVQRKSIP